MKLVMTHGYMLSGSGSNVYVQNLCRALARTGHEVHLLCQDSRPFDYDFVDSAYTASGNGVRLLEERKTGYPGGCAVYRPQIGDLLPVYVYDKYPGWRVKTFLDLTEEEFEDYVRLNAAALRSVLSEAVEPGGLVTNHSVPGPLIARRALEESPELPYVSVVHGSCLQYVARRSEFYMQVAREGLAGAARIVALSGHSTGTIADDFPEMREKAVSLPGGVDTRLFTPESLDRGRLASLGGGPGRGPEQENELEALLDGRPEGTRELASGLARISEGYSARAHDTDAGERISALIQEDEPLVLYVGRLSREKDLDQLLEPIRALAPEGVRMAFVGSGPGRRELEELFAGTPTVFTGYLAGEELAAAYASADVFAFPSTTETLGLVALESMASGVPVVGARAGGIPFVIDDGVTGFLVEPGDTQGYADRLRRVLLEPGLATRLGEAARADAERHSWRASTESLVTSYHLAVERHVGRAPMVKALRARQHRDL